MSEKEKAEKPIPVEPVAKNYELFTWLDNLFNGGSQYPERVDVCITTGQHNQKLVTPMLSQLLFAPQTEEKPDKKSTQVTPGRRRPDKEGLVHLANEILGRCQSDCEAQGKPTTYGCFAGHFSRESGYYDRVLLPIVPKNSGVGSADSRYHDEDDQRSMDERRTLQALDHDEKMFTIVADTASGLVDRMNREIDGLRAELRETRAQLARANEMLEKALDRQHERQKDLMWQELKVASVGKAIDMAVNVAPSIVNAIAGKRLISGPDLEALALKIFLPTSQGGKLTSDQFDALFGTYDEKGVPTKAGVFTTMQGEIICNVAMGNTPSTALDQVMPGTPHEITAEQVAHLQQVVPMELLVPIMGLFTARMEQQKGKK